MAGDCVPVTFGFYLVLPKSPLEASDMNGMDRPRPADPVSIRHTEHSLSLRAYPMTVSHQYEQQEKDAFARIDTTYGSATGASEMFQ